MSPLTLAHNNGSAAIAPSPAWLQESVREFFTNINWENRVIVQPTPAPTLELLDDLGTAPVGIQLHLAMRVNEYFGAIPWDGLPIVAAPPPVEEVVVEQENTGFTLDDFSDLF